MQATRPRLSRYTDDQDGGTIDLEVCEQTRGVLKCRLSRDTLLLTVDAGAAAALQTEPTIEVAFDVDDDLHESVRATLRRIFRDRLEMLEDESAQR